MQTTTTKQSLPPPPPHPPKKIVVILKKEERFDVCMGRCAYRLDAMSNSGNEFVLSAHGVDKLHRQLIAVVGFGEQLGRVVESTTKTITLKCANTNTETRTGVSGGILVWYGQPPEVQFTPGGGGGLKFGNLASTLVHYN